MKPENAIRFYGDVVKNNDNFQLEIERLNWIKGIYGVSAAPIEGITVWHEPLVLAFSNENETVDFVNEHFDKVVKVSLGIPVDGVKLQNCAVGGESEVYFFQLCESKFAVAYIKYVDVLSGIDKLEAMTLLRGRGCEICRPVFASNRSLISELIAPKRKLVSNENDTYMKIMRNQIDKLICTSSELKKDGLWRPWWRIDWNNRNNFLPVFDENGSLVSACCVDPVAVDRSAWMK